MNEKEFKQGAEAFSVVAGKNIMPDLIILQNACDLRSWIDDQKWDWKTFSRAVEVLDTLRTAK
jgi:hypothetical protein